MSRRFVHFHPIKCLKIEPTMRCSHLSGDKDAKDIYYTKHCMKKNFR